MSLSTSSGNVYRRRADTELHVQGFGYQPFRLRPIGGRRDGSGGRQHQHPVPITLDGRQHTIEIPMEAIAYTSYDAGDNLTLQITSSATAFWNFTSYGLVNISNIKLDIPTVANPLISGSPSSRLCGFLTQRVRAVGDRTVVSGLNGESVLNSNRVRRFVLPSRVSTTR